MQEIMKEREIKMRPLLFITPSTALGGVKTLIKKMYIALKAEGFHIQFCSIKIFVNSMPLINSYMRDIFRFMKSSHYDAVIYFGSIATLGSFIEKLRGVPIVVFISGHPIYELTRSIRDTTIDYRAQIGGLINLSYAKFTYFANIADLWVCHTFTTCEEIDVNKYANYVLLKQFVLPSEVKYFDEVRSKIMEISEASNKPYVQVFSYLPYVNLPGLKSETLVKLFNHIRKKVSKPVRFIIEDPTLKGVIQVNESIYIIGRMSWNRYLTTLVSSDLYVETTIDEELRFTSMEAALLKVPITKIVAPVYSDRVDYTMNDILIANSIREFRDLIIEYINKVDYYKQLYSNNVYKFVVDKRIWDSVKYPFINAVYSLIEE
jgi:hypothetical protein